MAKLVVFDMDGVLADTESSWVYVHRHFQVNNDHSLHAYLKGEIDDLEFIRRDIALWKAKEPGVTEGRIDDILSKVPIMPGAKETVSALKGRGVRTAIVSAGIDLLSRRIARELGIDMELANGLSTDGTGRLSGEGVLRVKLMDKGDSVVEAARVYGIDLSETVAVGNSRYDVSMFERAGRGIAFQPMDGFVRDRADAVVEEKDLSLILGHL
ncbi:MAG: HAD-IB family phosphatase [Thermoplasmata archaeon]|nr:HAD-IB family phosphatase [Thermoplasmata archaeon]